MVNGAGEGIRTLDPNLGKVVLYCPAEGLPDVALLRRTDTSNLLIRRVRPSMTRFLSSALVRVGSVAFVPYNFRTKTNLISKTAENT